ncbi:glycosyltransferase family 2 protein [Candidatus Pacearchaeota archaeon]|nr:glycosyltransferase family 2 protein [Candidatus Pacearchaeota archaeon]
MVEVITWVYLFYMFIALYFLILFTLTFIQNRKEMFYYPKLTKTYGVSVLIPAYNEEDSIEGTVESILNLDYKNIIEIIVINDGSKDRTKEIVQKLEKKYNSVILFDKINSGKADSLNQAIKIAKGELIAVVDADSYPSKDSFKKMIGFFNDSKVGAVTTRIFVREPKTFIQKLQSIEYRVIAFSRKLLGFLDAIYVTPGPLAIYRKSALEKIGGFDPKNLTEDIEITWHLTFEGYKVKMSLEPYVTTVSPSKFKPWFKQRLRWNIGGMQTISKYKKYFFKKGMLGFFILPFFTFSLLLGIVGLGIFIYRILRRFIVYYLSTKYSIESQVAVIVMEDINLNPSVLNFFGVILLILGALFLLFALFYVNKSLTKKDAPFIPVIFYSLVYMTLYPIILITSLCKFLKGGKHSW